MAYRRSPVRAPPPKRAVYLCKTWVTRHEVLEDEQVRTVVN